MHTLPGAHASVRPSQPMAAAMLPGGAKHQLVGSQPQHANNRLSTVAHSQRLHDSSPRGQLSSWWPWLVPSHGPSNSSTYSGTYAAVTHPSTLVEASVSMSSAPSEAARGARAADSTFYASTLPQTPASAPAPETAELFGQLLQRNYDTEAPALAPEHLPTTTVRFEVPHYATSPGQKLVIVGSVPSLGSWDFEAGARLTWHKGHRWTGEIQLEPGWHGALEFKVALVDRNTHIWEPGSNRLLVVERPRATKQYRATPGRNAGFQATISMSSVDEMDSSSSTADQGPVLHVECNWGKAEAPAPPLPPSMLCATGKMGMLANGMPLSTPHMANEGDAGSSLVMANCQVVVPWLEPGLVSAATDEASGSDGLHMVLVGSVPALGCWDPAQGLRLAVDDAGMWRGRLELPMGYSVQAKLALWDSVARVVRTWEPGGNRTFRLPEPPASLSQHRELSGSGSAAQEVGSSSMQRAGEVAGATTRAQVMNRSITGPWPVMPNGEFMLLTHWGTPGYPHLVFLPSLDYAVPSTGPRSARPSTVMCRFTVPHLPTQPNQHLLLVGSTPKLGNWDPTRGLRLQWGPGHSWQAGVHLPAEDETVEAKVVLWDGAAYRWEPGPNRSMRPGQLITDVAPHGTWGEVLHILYWGGAQEAGRTPAVVIPQDELLALTAASPSTASSGSKGKAADRESQAGSSTAQAPSMALVQMLSTLAAVALQANDPGHFASLFESHSRGQAGGASGVVSSLEAAMDELRTQLAEAQAARHREVESVRSQLLEANKSLAAEEDEVEALHVQLGSRTAEMRNLQQQLARAEATAAAAVAAATTALSSASSMYAAANGGANGAEGTLLRAAAGNEAGQAVGGLDPGAGNLPGLAAATFQKLTEQLAVLQLEADTARRSLTEAHAARSAEVAHLRAELSDAVALRHKEAEAARLAAATMQLHHQQELSMLQASLSDAQGARQREMTALQARLEAVAASGAGETSRLVRQLAQACAAAEALESQLMAQRASASNGGTEVRRLRGLLSSQAHELEALKGQLADGHAAAAVGRLSWGSGGTDTSPAGDLVVAGGAHSHLDHLVLAGEAAEPAMTTIGELPPHLAGVMAEVRAAKAALEQLTSSGLVGHMPMPAVGVAEEPNRWSQTAGARAAATATNGSSWPGSNGNGSGRHVQSNIVPRGGYPSGSHNGANGQNGNGPQAGAGGGESDGGDRE